MEVVREFLESSTIHGLSYIQTAKVRKRCLLEASVEIYIHCRVKLSSVFGSLLCALVLLDLVC